MRPTRCRRCCRSSSWLLCSTSSTRTSSRCRSTRSTCCCRSSPFCWRWGWAGTSWCGPVGPRSSPRSAAPRRSRSRRTRTTRTGTGPLAGRGRPLRDRAEGRPDVSTGGADRVGALGRAAAVVGALCVAVHGGRPPPPAMAARPSRRCSPPWPWPACRASGRCGAVRRGASGGRPRSCTAACCSCTSCCSAPRRACPEHLAGAYHPASAGAGLGMWGGLLLAALQVAVAAAVLVSGRLPQVDPVGVRAG